MNCQGRLEGDQSTARRVAATALGAASVELQKELGLVGNGPDSTLGNFDEARLEGFLAIAGPVFGNEGLTPADLMTNEYIDESIGL